MSGITIKNKKYKGWKKSIEISNSEIRIILVPEIGRIMYYGFVGGENIFYENQEFEGRAFSSGEYYKKTVKHYLFNHVRTSFLNITADEMAIGIFLPVARFIKGRPY